jgi:hypothetical protein
VKSVNGLSEAPQPFPILCLINCSIRCLAMFPLVSQAVEYASSYGPGLPQT